MKTLVLRRWPACGMAGTAGVLELDGEELCYSVERPWKGNEPYVSCVPEGNYPLRYEESPKFGRRLHVQAVEGRSHILIHAGNRVCETMGCILPNSRIELGANTVIGKLSRIALLELESRLPDDGTEYRIDIRDSRR